MSTRGLRIAASALILAALALLVVGLGQDWPAVWGLDLLAVAVAMVLSLATRWSGSGPVRRHGTEVPQPPFSDRWLRPWGWPAKAGMPPPRPHRAALAWRAPVLMAFV